MYSHNRDKDNFEIKFQQLNQIITKLRGKYFCMAGLSFTLKRRGLFSKLGGILTVTVSPIREDLH